MEREPAEDVELRPVSARPAKAARTGSSGGTKNGGMSPEELLTMLLNMETKFDTDPSIKTPDPCLKLVETICVHYTEANWLNENALVTPESVDSNAATKKFSEIFSNDHALHIEFDKTVVGILCLLWVIKNQYEQFVWCQKVEATRLTKESFKDLREFTLKCLPDLVGQEALLVTTVLNDLGKVESLVELVRSKTAVEEVDHDKILYMGLKAKPTLFPSFERLDKKYQTHILEGLDAQFNFAQFVQGENVPYSLLQMRALQKRADSLNLFLLHALYDMAGAAGAGQWKGSVVLLEDTYKDIRMAMDSLQELTTEASYQEVVDIYYDKRGRSLGLSAHFQTQRALIRLCCMLRYHTAAQAAAVSAAAEAIPHETWTNLRRELCVSGLDGQHAILLYYAPALLLNYQMKLSSEEDKKANRPNSEGIKWGLQVLDKLFRQCREHIADRKGNGCFTADIADIAAKSKEIPKALAEPHQAFILTPVGEDAKMSVKLDS